MPSLFRTNSGSRQGPSTPLRTRVQTVVLCKNADTVPAVGGIEVPPEHLERYPLLPPYVVLHEPSQQDIWLGPKMRAIFLNQPLTDWEQAEIAKLRQLMLEEMNLSSDADVPRWIRPHLSRLLQQTKYKAEAAAKIYPTIYAERVENLPISYEDIRPAMETGCVYWHGRDIRCRPLLVIRIGRAAKLIDQGVLVQKLFLFTMEFAVRHLLIPGRVENWNVLIDCDGIGTLPGMMKCKEFGQAIATTLGKVYSGRMVWTKIINFPKSWTYLVLRKAIESIVSALGKSDKVSFVQDASTEFAGSVELGQLEKWAGGNAPDLPIEATYPYRMFSEPGGYGATPSATNSEYPSLHALADLEFKEGMLWADCLEKQTSWKTKAKELPLPPGAAEAVGGKPVREITSWRDCMLQRNPDALGERPEDASQGVPKTDAAQENDAVKAQSDATGNVDAMKPQDEPKEAPEESAPAKADSKDPSGQAGSTIIVEPRDMLSEENATFPSKGDTKTVAENREVKHDVPELATIEAERSAIGMSNCFFCGCVRDSRSSK